MLWTLQINNIRYNFMNTLIIVKISNVTYDEWKKKFDLDAEV